MKALQLGLAVGLLVLLGLAERSTGAAVQWPVLLLVLIVALLAERHQRRRARALRSAPARPAGATASVAAARRGLLQRLRLWVDRQISDGVVHGHEEGERCNGLCRRTRAQDRSWSGPDPHPTARTVPVGPHPDGQQEPAASSYGHPHQFMTGDSTSGRSERTGRCRARLVAAAPATAPAALVLLPASRQDRQNPPRSSLRVPAP